MNTNHQSSYWLAIAADLPESPETLVLLDAGSGTDPSLWNPVIDSLASSSVLIMVGQYGPGTDLHEATSVIVSGTNEARRNHPGLVHRILVGSQRGSHALQLAISEQTSIATHLVLIDPEPIAHVPGCADHWSITLLQERIPVPTTIILHGSTAPDSADAARRAAQESEIRSFPNRREILAGRSRTCILSERPDVVIEAIKSLPGMQSHNVQRSGT
ncbi:MAG: hypothetical protein EA415_10310 [Sphaerobacteraceae bacterium]|nr:MAG: hypothetical protein EA415_10310 [Sphaerobacteraceae bacterium]